MIKLISILVIGVLIISNIYFINENKKINCNYIKLEKKYKMRASYMLSDSVDNMNIYYTNPELLPLSLHAEASAYFTIIGENNNSDFTIFNKNQYGCLNWTNNTKEKYKISFLDYSKIKEFNNTHNAFLKGLDITDSICQKKNK